MMERNELVVVTQLDRQHAPSRLLLVLIAGSSADCVGEAQNVCVCVASQQLRGRFQDCDDVLQHLLTGTL